MERVETTGKEEKWQNDKELQQVASEDHNHIFAQRVHHHSPTDLCRKLRRKGEDAQRQRPYQPTDEHIEQILETLEELYHHSFLPTLGHTGKGNADGKGKNQYREHVAFQQGAHDIIRYHGEDMVIISEMGDVFRHGIQSLLYRISRQIARSDE